MASPLLGFAFVAVILVITPGPDFAVIVPNALRGRGVQTSLGTVSGLAVHAGIAVAGISAVVLASDLAFSVVKFAGATFLLYLGVRALLKARAGGVSGAARSKDLGLPTLTRARAYRQGLVVNVMNPKAPLIYLSIMPQFLLATSPATPQLLAMSSVLVATALAWYLVLTLLVSRLREALERSRKWIDRMTGAVLIGLGVRMALESRPT